MLVTIGYRRMRDRREMVPRARGFGYRLINYVAPRARTYPDLAMGENNILFDDVYVGPFGVLGSNNVIRPQTYVGHDVRMGDHAFVAPGVSIGGRCRIGDLSFVGIGATVVDGVTIGRECLIGAAALLLRDAEPLGAYLGHPAKRVRELADTGVVVGDGRAPPASAGTARSREETRKR